MRPEQKPTVVAWARPVLACAVLIALALVATPAIAQTSSQSLLPSSFAGWTQSSSGPFSPPSGIPSTASSDYGLSSASQATYKRGSNQLNVTLYSMKDASGAYGEYTLLRTPDMVQGDLAQYSATSRDDVLVLMGNLVLDIHGQDLRRFDAQLKSLVAALAPHAQEAALPSLLSELPEQGLIPRTEHYVLSGEVLNQFFPVQMGDSVGFASGAEAELAKYRVEGRDLTLLIVDYPTPQSAAAHLKSLQKEFDIVDTSAKENADNANGASILYENRTLTSLVFVAGAGSERQADVLLAHLQSGDVLTWNEPTFSLTQPSIGTMIVGTIIGTGLICMFALISGLAFGGVRVMVKAILPGKVFDRSKEMDILQLGLSSKPIKAEDFYGSP